MHGTWSSHGFARAAERAIVVGVAFLCATALAVPGERSVEDRFREHVVSNTAPHCERAGWRWHHAAPRMSGASRSLSRRRSGEFLAHKPRRPTGAHPFRVTLPASRSAPSAREQKRRLDAFRAHRRGHVHDAETCRRLAFPEISLPVPAGQRSARARGALCRLRTWRAPRSCFQLLCGSRLLAVRPATRTRRPTSSAGQPPPNNLAHGKFGKGSQPVPVLYTQPSGAPLAGARFSTTAPACHVPSEAGGAPAA